STWPAVGLLWSILLLYVIIRRDRLPWRQVLAWVLACGGVAFLTIAPWGYLFIAALQDERASFLTPQGNPNAMFSGMWHIPLQMTWGGDLPRGMLTLVLLGCGIFGGLKNAIWRPVVSVFLAIALGLFALIAVTLQYSAGLFAVRYFLPLWLVLLFISAVGLLWLGETIHGILFANWRERVRDIHVAALLFVGVAALMARPIVCILTLTGNPLEYSKMSRWMDAHLPRGSVVVTEGWLGPAHMWRQHMPTNVFITFTVPDEPLANYTKHRTREVTREFFLRNPDAAFLEMSRTYHRVPGMGRWTFPLQHFKRQVGFTNEEALALREMQLGATEDFYGVDTNNIDVLLFYNLPEDILARARQEGRPVVMLFGPGWQYMKTRDFRDWRGLAASAVIELHNLTPAPIEVTVTLRGVAGNGAKQVRTDRGDQQDFHNMRLDDWTLKPVLLAPGRTDIVLSDPLWGIAKVPLLVEFITIKPEEHKPANPGAPVPP
ncbi:MAG: hypothetical protein HY343_12150, partial [Lentisphaerae bacterium]|nr:hypothetical protein [Lentisphaerota bacterium]